VELMRQLSPESTWNSEAEGQLRYRMDNADLKFPFRRPRSSQSRRAIFHVLAELADAGRIGQECLRVYEQIFCIFDPDLVVYRPVPRPEQVLALSRAQHDEFTRDWLKAVHHDKWLLCENMGDRLVLAEKTQLKAAGSGNPSESRKSVLCSKRFEHADAGMDDSRLFPTLIRQLVSSYHGLSLDHDFPAVVHCAFGSETPGEGWLAFNPGVARSLGWTPSAKGLLAWEQNEQLMVETIWWNDGSLPHSMPFYRKLEIGEGWLVVACQEAAEQLASCFGPLRRIGAISREIVDQRKQRETEGQYIEL